MRLLKILFPLVICFFCGIMSVFGQTENKAGNRLNPPPSVNDLPDKIITLDFRDMDIHEALKFIAAKAGINVILTKNVTGRVSLTVNDVSLRDIFDIILRSNSLAYVKKGNIFNIMTEAEYKEFYGRGFFDSRVFKIFRLQYAIPEQAFNLLTTMKSDIGKLLLDTDSGVILVIDTPERVKTMEDTLQAMEHKNVIMIFDLKYARAKDVEDQLKNQLDLKKVGSIKSDERTNQVIVQTLPNRMEDISRLIESLDQKTRQILMDAKIIQVKLTNENSAGVEWQGLFDVGGSDGLTYLGSAPFSSVTTDSTDAWRSRSTVLSDMGGNVGSYSFANSTAGTKVGTESVHFGMVKGNKDFDTVLKYLQTLGETRILSNPKLAVVNNHEAKIHVGEKQAYITTTTTQTETSTTVSEAVTYVDLGIQLMVTPTINQDGFVTVKIKPEISSVVDYLETASNNRIPIIDSSTAETIVMVKDGSSILIGGLTKQEKTLSSEGTPFLSKLPLIGGLFKSATNTSVRSELVVLLTPHIINGDELTNGNPREFKTNPDKEYQGYGDFTEAPEKVEYKSYNPYPSIKSESDIMPGGIKPARNF